MAEPWSERVDELLYSGEQERASQPVGAGRVVVTSHRVLAFTPAGDGSNYRHVDLPNVVGAGVESTGRRWLLEVGAKAGVVGLFGLAAGAAFDFEEMIGGVSVQSSGAGQLGVGGLVSLTNSVITLFGMLDDLLLVAGSLATLLAVGLLGVYLHTRQREFVIRVAGEDAIRLPVDGDADVEAARTVVREAMNHAPAETKRSPFPWE